MGSAFPQAILMKSADPCGVDFSAPVTYRRASSSVFLLCLDDFNIHTFISKRIGFVRMRNSYPGYNLAIDIIAKSQWIIWHINCIFDAILIGSRYYRFVGALFKRLNANKLARYLSYMGSIILNQLLKFVHGAGCCTLGFWRDPVIGLL